MSRRPAPLRALVVDDERPARQRITQLARSLDGLHVIGESSDGERAVTDIIRLRPELVFLDIQMPGLTGFEVVQAVGVGKMPPVVFVTAYDHYALAAFDVHAVDYLLKPFTAERFAEAVRKAIQEIGRRRVYPSDRSLHRLLQSIRDDGRLEERILIRSPQRVAIVPIADIDRVDAAGNYVRLHTGREEHLLRETMLGITQRLEPHGFVRTHRSHLVDIRQVRRVVPLTTGDFEIQLKSGDVIPLSRRYRDAFEARFQA